MLKEDLAATPRYSLKRLYDEVDKSGTDCIDRANLKAFLLRGSFIPNDNLVLAIIRRMDLDCDAKLSYMEFVEAVRPVEDQPTARIKSAKARTFRKATTPMNSRPIHYIDQGITIVDDGDLSRAPESSLSPNTTTAYRLPPGPQRQKSAQNQAAVSASRVVRARPTSKSLRVKPVAKQTIYGRAKENSSLPRAAAATAGAGRMQSPSRPVDQIRTDGQSKIHRDYEVGSPNIHKELYVPARYAQVPIANLARPDDSSNEESMGQVRGRQSYSPMRQSNSYSMRTSSAFQGNSRNVNPMRTQPSHVDIGLDQGTAYQQAQAARS